MKMIKQLLFRILGRCGVFCNFSESHVLCVLIKSFKTKKNYSWTQEIWFTFDEFDPLTHNWNKQIKQQKPKEDNQGQEK